MKNVLDWLENASKEYKHKVAYKDTNSMVSFLEFEKNAKRIGSALKTIEGTAPIAVFGSRRIETIEAFVGVVYSGHSYAPIDVMLPDNRIEEIISILQPAAILTDDVSLGKISNISGTIPVLAIEKTLGNSVDEGFLDSVKEKIVSSQPLYVLFTSGSTGKPKGVVTSHQSLMCYIQSYAFVMNINKGDILGNQSPLDYIAAIRDIYLPILTGATSVIIPKELFMQPSRLFEFINNNNINTLGWSVSAFTITQKLGAFEGVKPVTVEKVCFSGAIMPSDCLLIWQKNLPNALFVNQYGPTEVTASCTYYKVDHMVSEKEIIPIGKAYRNYQVFLLNEDLRPTAPGEIGEICVSGPALALGYYNDPERTRRSFVDNPNIKEYPERMYRTGDYGRVREDGMLEFHGRKDRQIKHLGHRIELDEIDFAANRIPGVKESLALYDKDAEVVTLFYSGDINKKELVTELKKNLPGFMIPRKLIALEELPRLSNGKLDINTLNTSINNVGIDSKMP